MRARLVAGAVVAYALSPIDLVPDFIPVLGYLDDLVIVPFGFAFAVKMIPSPVLHELRRQANVRMESRYAKWLAACGIAALWLGLAGAIFILLS